ncbi:MAG: hypothetical protein JWN46_2598 [Acidimicrobiales bacterium]|nr:hypothetical protein [Acidimicrobiales bacterium]
MSPIITMLVTTFIVGIAGSFVLAQRRTARVGWQSELNGIRQEVLVAPGFNDLRSVEAAGHIEPLQASGVWTDLAAATRKQAATSEPSPDAPAPTHDLPYAVDELPDTRERGRYRAAARARVRAAAPDRPTDPVAAMPDAAPAPGPRADAQFDESHPPFDDTDPLDGMSLEPVTRLPFHVAVEPATRPELIEALETTFGPAAPVGTVTERPNPLYVEPPPAANGRSFAGASDPASPYAQPATSPAFDTSAAVSAEWTEAPAAERGVQPAAEWSPSLAREPIFVTLPEPILEPSYDALADADSYADANFGAKADAGASGEASPIGSGVAAQVAPAVEAVEAVPTAAAHDDAPVDEAAAQWPTTSPAAPDADHEHVAFDAGAEEPTGPADLPAATATARPVVVESVEVLLANGGAAHEVRSAGAQLRIGASVPTVTNDPERGMQARLDEGWCWCRTEATGSTPTLLVPGAVVRPANATTLLVVVEPDGASFVAVVEGDVELNRPNGRTCLRQGALADLAPDGRFQVDVATAAEIEADALVRTNRALDEIDEIDA